MTRPSPELVANVDGRLSVQDLTQRLAQVLPQAVDKLTPDGTIPGSR
jgi:uncharacterized protein YidB (DUF937 family)